MKKLIITMISLAFVFWGCGKSDITETTELFANTIADKTETAVTTEEVVTSEITAPLNILEQPKEFSMDNAVSVEDYYGGDVFYKADFDGDGEKEICKVQIVGHGTQCYVEDIEITKTNGEKLVIEHPVTATGTRASFYKFEDRYELYFHNDAVEDTVIIYPFTTLSTAKENLIPPAFGDIFDYSVIGDKLYFRGSIACGFSEVLGDAIYEYEYRDGALRVSHIRYRDYINEMDYDVGRSSRGSAILVDPCKEDKNNVTLPLGEPLVEARAIMGNPTFLVYDKGLTYYVKQYTSPLNDEYILRKYTLSLPYGYTDGVIISDGPGGGSGELGFMVRAKKGNTDVVFSYLFYADRLAAPVEVWEETDVAFTPDNGSRLYEVYACPDRYFCFVRTYANDDDEILYYVINISGGQCIRYDKEDGAHPAEAKDLVTFADINFDGYEDLCLKLGNFGAQGTAIMRAYLRSGYDEYTLCESFEKIPNPVVDVENKQILGTNRESAAEHFYARYEYNGNEFVEVSSLLYNVADEKVKIGGEVLSSDEFVQPDSEWDILSAKWSDIITEK